MKAFIFLFLLVFNFIVGGLLWDYSITYWASHFSGNAANVPFLPCCFLGLFTAQIAIPVAIITWILSYLL